MKKILIFYASFGGGHLSAANSIKQCIDENFDGYETNLIDCFLYVNKYGKNVYFIIWVLDFLRSFFKKKYNFKFVKK